jgi:hypothetical protein
MKLRGVCLLLLWLAVCAGSASAKNHVYKGFHSLKDLVTGETRTVNTYLVLGDEGPIDPNDPSYARLSGTFVIKGGALGPKRYAVESIGVFRTIEVNRTIGGKERTFEIITLCSDSAPTDSGETSHHFSGTVLIGEHTSPLYKMPKVLRGTGLSSSGQLELPRSTGWAHKANWYFELVPDLTDPIPTGESLADSVQRVKDFLESRGFIEVAQ